MHIHAHTRATPPRHPLSFKLSLSHPHREMCTHTHMHTVHAPGLLSIPMYLQWSVNCTLIRLECHGWLCCFMSVLVFLMPRRVCVCVQSTVHASVTTIDVWADPRLSVPRSCSLWNFTAWQTIKLSPRRCPAGQRETQLNYVHTRENLFLLHFGLVSAISWLFHTPQKNEGFKNTLQCG